MEVDLQSLFQGWKKPGFFKTQFSRFFGFYWVLLFFLGFFKKDFGFFVKLSIFLFVTKLLLSFLQKWKFILDEGMTRVSAKGWENNDMRTLEKLACRLSESCRS